MLGFPKPSPWLLEQRKAKAGVAKTDRDERAKVRARSGGACEVWFLHLSRGYATYQRCDRRATENHHLLGGIGRRNRGRSILAAHRLDVCKKCHTEITGKVLVPCVEQSKAECAATVRYERRS